MSESRGWSFPDYAHVGFRKSAGRCVHCAVYCYRECALCGRWVCHACRHGSGWWVACQGCDVHELARARVRHELADAHERMIAAYEAWAHKCLRCGAPHGLWARPPPGRARFRNWPSTVRVYDSERTCKCPFP